VVDRSFDAFVLRRSARLLRTAYLLCGDRGAAEDLVQVALVRVAQRWEAVRGGPDAYTHQVLVNLARDRHRRAGRRVSEQPLHDEDVAVPDAAELIAQRDELAGAVERLPARQREVIVLRYFADLSVEDTAAAIGASPGAVKKHTNRALACLREVLADTGAARW
jgi:RNA polymerase sigma-70 factor (sigma-E family)